MKFKEWDLVRPNAHLLFNKRNLYIIDYEYQRDEIHYVFLKQYFGGITNKLLLGGWHVTRFKKIPTKDLTEKEKFRIIKYKLGVRDECQKKSR